MGSSPTLGAIFFLQFFVSNTEARSIKALTTHSGTKCRDPGSNRGPLDLQSNALPTELSRLRDGIWGQNGHIHNHWTLKKKTKKEGSTEIWTRIAGFRVLSANHYTIEPIHCWCPFWTDLIWNNTFLYTYAYFCRSSTTKQSWPSG